jgi:AbrB family looped-hinge helix DNA binding protein
MTKLLLAKVTRKGQITIPKELREALGIQAGDYVALRPVMDGVLISKAAIGSLVPIASPATPEDASPHLLGPADRRTAHGAAQGGKNLNEAVEEIEEEVYRESTGG